MTRNANRLASSLMAGSVALLTALPALAAARADRPVEAWSALEGVPIPALLQQAQDLPVSDMAVGDQPYCAKDREIQQTLKHDFDEKPVDASQHAGTQLWGSQQMGTWTLVAPRPDDTSCIIASGIGYQDSRDVKVYYRTAGLK
jgi:hypothetical protein